MTRIVAVRKDKAGKIVKYKLDDTRELTLEDAIMEVDAGLIDGVAVFDTRDGSRSIRSNRGQVGYSLSGLPEF